MSNKINEKPEWKELNALQERVRSLRINDLFNESDRFDDFSLSFGDLFFDYSKQHVTKDVIDALLNLARSFDLEKRRDEMFAGKKINNTENRAVLHTALRRPANDMVNVDDENVIKDIHETLNRIEEFSNNVRDGSYVSANGKKFKNIIALGTGGSYLGPCLVSDAVKNKDEPLNVHFVANIDEQDIHRALEQCEAETTLFVVVSKTFTTQETMTNAAVARHWLKENLGDDADIQSHLCAVSSNVEKANEFGIKNDNVFPMWDWVNGRFSLWSAVGLPIALSCGFNKFRELLNGAHAMDQHFVDAPLEENMPVMLAVLGVWNTNFLDYNTHALLPYETRLTRFADFIQQLEMESNGKSVTLDGSNIDYKTCPVIFGGVGTNSQHSFFQLLHQGTDKTPCDFIGVKKPIEGYEEQHILLLNNMLAQSQAMMQGQENKENPHKNFDGNIPSSTILIDELNAYNLGMLLALYEHKTFVQGVLWDLNSFDQFGVELGKALSTKIGSGDLGDADASTKALYTLING